MSDTLMERLAVLAKCPGMDEAKAKRLLRLMPDLGLVTSPVAVRLAGLDVLEGRCPIGPKKQRNSFYIRRLLAESLPDILADKDSHLAYFLRHLMERYDDQNPVRVCLAAVLRHYNDALRNPGDELGDTPVVIYEGGDDDILLASEPEEE